MWLTAAWVAQQPVEATRFAPVIDRRYRYDTIELRDGGATTRRYLARRSVIFRRAGDGYVAEVTLERVEQQAGAGRGTMVERAMSALLHRTLRFHVDRMGIVGPVEDADSAFAAIVAAVSAIGRDGARDRRRRPAALTAPLVALSPAQRAAMLASTLAPLLPGVMRPDGERNVRLSARAPLPPGMALLGTERTARERDTLTIELEASGALADAQVSLQQHQRFDRATGLLRDSSARRETRVGAATSIIETQVTLVLE